jgi:uncharacterized protein (DUF433 family)/DNA-binding transcriptional MerR regulator
VAPKVPLLARYYGGMGKLTLLPSNGQTEWQGFYTTGQASRLTRVPEDTLRLWRKFGVKPAVELIGESGAYARGYSYQQLAFIRVLRDLREHGISLLSAVAAVKHLADRFGDPSSEWATAKVGVAGGHLWVYGYDGWGTTDASLSGQTIQTQLLEDLLPEFHDLAPGDSVVVPSAFRKHIAIDPKIMGGEPVLRGYGVPTSTLITMFERYGRSLDKLIKVYRPIPRESIENGILYQRSLSQAA